MISKKVVMLGVLGIGVSVLFSIAFLTLPATVEGKAKVVAIEGIAYNVDSSLSDNLKSLTGKKVYVTLDSGKTFAGTVKEVGNHLMHMEKLDGKEFFDALIRIENISAVDTRFRAFQR